MSSAAPPIIENLARLARLSFLPELRSAPWQVRHRAAAMIVIGASTRSTKPKKIFTRSLRSILLKPKEIRSCQLFDRHHVIEHLGLDKDLEDIAAFRAWIAAGAAFPTAREFEFAATREDEPQSDPMAVFEKFILEEIWAGTLSFVQKDAIVVQPSAFAKDSSGFAEFAGQMRKQLRAIPDQEALIARFKGKDIPLTQARRHLANLRKDVSSRLESGTLGHLAAKAAELDTLIMHPSRSQASVVIAAHANHVLRASNALQELHKQCQHRRARAVVVIPHCRMSGAARVAGVLSGALARRYGADEIVVLRTEQSALDYPDWFAQGCRHVDLSAVAGNLRPEHRSLLLFMFLRSLGPDHVFNVNSRLMWDTMRSYSQAMADAFANYAYLFCSDINQDGVEAGYPVHFFYRYFDHLSGVMTDSNHLRDQLRTRFLVAEDNPKLDVLRTPVTPVPDLIERAPKSSNQRRKIYWAGRFDKQKRLDIVIEIARRMPDCDFLVWGKPVLDKHVDLSKLPKNINLRGIYGEFSELPLQDCDVWLYTAAWEGVPTLMMDVAAAGIPLVASLVGGTGDVLVEGLCHRQKDIEDIDGWVKALRDALEQPDLAWERANAMRTRLLKERSKAAYDEGLARFLMTKEAV